jgi:hypothetical protein
MLIAGNVDLVAAVVSSGWGKLTTGELAHSDGRSIGQDWPSQFQTLSPVPCLFPAPSTQGCKLTLTPLYPLRGAQITAHCPWAWD